MGDNTINSTALDTQSQKTKQSWGRVLLCGGTDWPRLGKKDKVSEANPDLGQPHTLRSLLNINATNIYTSHSGCHVVVLDVHGTAHLFGRNTASCLGVPGVPFISESEPRRLRASHLGASLETKFTSAACGRGHTLLIDDDGSVWSAGLNSMGQCGHSPQPEISTFRLIRGPWCQGDTQDRIVKASAGLTFSLVLTESGKVYAFGSAEKGQLGNGRTGEHITTGNKSAFDIESDPIRVRELDDKKIVQIASGQQHSIALDDQGLVYVWGTGGYCRTGLGTPKDQLVPVMVPKFANEAPMMRAEFVTAGVASTVVIDRQGMYWLAGKWKNSGDGSAGQPYSNFRYLQDIMSCRIQHASCGGVTQFAICPAEDTGVMTIAWGQNANNYELGMGDDAPKSATKPQQCHPLDGVDVFDIAAGQNTTFFLARPNDQLQELPRFPFDVESSEQCIVCGKEDEEYGEEATLLECEKCENPYHLGCLSPPLTAVPDGEWFCATCAADGDTSHVLPDTLKRAGSGKHGRSIDDGDEEDDGLPEIKKPRGKTKPVFKNKS